MDVGNPEVGKRASLSLFETNPAWVPSLDNHPVFARMFLQEGRVVSVRAEGDLRCKSSKCLQGGEPHQTVVFQFSTSAS